MKTPETKVCENCKRKAKMIDLHKNGELYCSSCGYPFKEEKRK